MLEQIRNGDVVIVTKYDRLGRSLKDLLEIVEWRRSASVVPASGSWPRASTPRRWPAVLCSISACPRSGKAPSGRFVANTGEAPS